jgi:hypothetical protein
MTMCVSLTAVDLGGENLSSARVCKWMIDLIKVMDVSLRLASWRKTLVKNEESNFCKVIG